MKIRYITIILVSAFLLNGLHMYAQDSVKTSAAKQITASSEQTDSLQGKRIQQQSLLNNKVERIDSVAVSKPAKKKKARQKHK